MFPKNVIILSVVLLWCAAATRASTCGAGSTCERYVVESFFKANWYKASQFCRYNGLQLATVSSDSDQYALIDQITQLGLLKERFWLSGNAIQNNRIFTWSSNGRALTFTKWGTGQPDNAGGLEDCVELSAGQTWSDSKCTEALYFVCERPYNSDL